MNIKSLSLLIVISLLTVIGVEVSVHSQTPSPTITPNVVNQSTAQTDAEKIAVLQAQLNLMREYDQRLLNTVYWSLGSLGAVILLIIGLGWYTNFRLYNRELDALKNSLKTEIQSSLRAEMTTAAEEAGKNAVHQIEISFKSLKREMKFMKYDLLKTEAQQWESGGYIANAIISYVEMAEVALEAEFEVYVTSALDALKKAFKAADSIPSGHAKKVTELINRLPPEYGADAETIRKLLLEARAK
jgi:hypothetical protein